MNLGALHSTTLTGKLVASMHGTFLRIVLGAGALTLLGALGSCGGSDGGGGGAGPTGSSDGGGCPQGFTPKTNQPSVCVEIAPQGACPAGTAPFLGTTDCTPVGWTSACPDGFVKDPSGWGCVDQTPAAACDGATRESLHATSCAPIGDCSGAPPPGALLVDDSFSAGQVDATHFQTIGAALNAASAGATVWVLAGAYSESLTVTKPVTLSGVCAEQVVVTAPPSTALPGVEIHGVTGVTVRGLTLRGHTRALDIVAGSDVTLDALLVDQSVAAGVFVEASKATLHGSKVAATAVGLDGRWGWGVAAGLGSTVTVDDSTLTGGVNGVFAASNGTVVTVQGSVILRQAPTSATRSCGVEVANGAKAIVEKSVIRDVAGDGTVVSDQGGHVEVSESVLRGTRVQGSQARGHGVVAIAGGQLVVRSSAITDVQSVSLDAQQVGSHLEVYDSVVRGPSESQAIVDTHLKVVSDKSGIGGTLIDHSTTKLDGVAILGAFGFGLYVQSGATADAHHVFIDQTRDLKTPAQAGSLSFAVGITVDEGGAMKLADSTVLHGRLAGASVGTQSSMDISGSLFQDVGEATPVGTGAGLSVGEGGHMTVARSAVVHTSAVGVLALNRGNASVDMTDCTIHDVHVASTGFGHGAMAGPQTTFTFERTALYNNGAVGLALAGGSARVHASNFTSNGVALHAQDGSYLVESDSDGALSEGELRVSSDTTFEGNGTKIGSGSLPLPEDPLK